MPEGLSGDRALVARIYGTLSALPFADCHKDESMDMPQEAFKPPSMSFHTLWTFLGDLSAKPLPPKLDRSIMSSKSGTDQNNLFAAMEGMGLIQDQGVISKVMIKFAESDADERAAILKTILRERYKGPLEVSANNGTPADLKEELHAMLGGATNADTVRKAMTFFLHAAQQAGIELSPHFPKTRTGSGSSTTKRYVKRSPKTSDKNVPGNFVAAGRSGTGHTQTVTLKSGGTVTLTYDVNMFEVDDQDEAFVLGLIKNLRGYSGPAPETGEEVSTS